MYFFRDKITQRLLLVFKPCVIDRIIGETLKFSFTLTYGEDNIFGNALNPNTRMKQQNIF